LTLLSNNPLPIRAFSGWVGGGSAPLHSLILTPAPRYPPAAWV